MKGSIKAVEIERLDAFWLGFKALLRDHKMQGAVLVLDDGSGRATTMAWPGCPEGCTTREQCMVGTLIMATGHLDRAVEKLESGTAITRKDEEIPMPVGMSEKKLMN